MNDGPPAPPDEEGSAPLSAQKNPWGDFSRGGISSEDHSGVSLCRRRRWTPSTTFSATKTSRPGLLLLPHNPPLITAQGSKLRTGSKRSPPGFRETAALKTAPPKSRYLQRKCTKITVVRILISVHPPWDRNNGPQNRTGVRLIGVV